MPSTQEQPGKDTGNPSTPSANSTSSASAFLSISPGRCDGTRKPRSRGHTGGFHVPFAVKDEKRRALANPYAEPPHIGLGGGIQSREVLRPGKTVIIKKTLNQCVHFAAAGTYTVSSGEYVFSGEKG